MKTHRLVLEITWDRRVAVILAIAVSLPVLAIGGLLTALAAHPAAAPAVTPTPAASTSVIPYQGRLADTGGNPLNGSYGMTFSLYTGAAGGSALWSDTYTPTVSNGLFNVMLGSGAVPISQSTFTGNGSLWLGIRVGADAEMAPRVQLGSAPYALEAQHARVADQTDAYYPLLRPQILDLAAVDASLAGFEGGFTDGRYGYFVPHNDGAPFGKVARVDLQNFTTGGVYTLDLTTKDVDLTGFSGGFTDGHYGYFAPYNNGGYFGKVARVDLQNFSTGGVTVLDLTTKDADLKGFRGGFTDGHYGYFVPDSNANGAYFGKAARVDLLNFTTGGVTVLDLTTVDASLKGFRAGFTDGRYGYFVPGNGGTSGKLARVDLQNFSAGGVTVLDLFAVDGSLTAFEGGFTDGRYGYFVPNHNGLSGRAARVDLQNFTTGGVTILDLTTVDASLKGFVGGFTDGRYGYFVPQYNGAWFGKVVRVDLQNFSTGGVAIQDLTAVDGNLTGFGGGFTDGRYGYFVPNTNGSSGKAARIQLFSGAGSP